MVKRTIKATLTGNLHLCPNIKDTGKIPIAGTEVEVSWEETIEPEAWQKWRRLRDHKILIVLIDHDGCIKLCGEDAVIIKFRNAGLNGKYSWATREYARTYLNTHCELIADAPAKAAGSTGTDGA